MYIETSGNNNNSANDNSFVSFERTDIIHIGNIAFYYNRFSISLSSHGKMGKLEIQILRNGSWETEYTMDKDTSFSALSTDWTLLNTSIISEPKYGINLIFFGITTAHADRCFSDINITPSNF